ncbi:NAD-dependent epimerase/dehydratase family protein [Actinomadura alba]|uniref:NAD-dependent epimerase/dehydratase family protein n=1 Tax=Actinomadura alba TaxID=406431 RepID=A0ABR7LUC2_9ACTN|nr:NAD-dependent epimerase/dehydratase family protein [Actinomadura alba]MBC6468087.1 NAD-dependent epimerase/dehydratase family protein [Actinomadura alba]
MGINACVIGGGSMIGSHLVDQLVADSEVDTVTIIDAVFAPDTQANLAKAVESPKVTVHEGDIRNYDQLRSLMQGTDEVYHLAGVMSLDGLGKERWMWEVNADGCFNVLEAARDLGVRRVVASSSAAVYGEIPGDSLFEESGYPRPRTVYGATKVATEALCIAYDGSMGLETNVLRYGIVYGPRLHRRAKSSLLVSDIIDAFLRDEQPIIQGDGSEEMEWVYVGDVARANIAAMRSECSGEVFNVGTGRSNSTRELVEIAKRITGSTQEPKYVKPETPHKFTQNIMSATKAEKRLGFVAETPLEVGIGHQIEFQRARLEPTR